MRYVAAVDANQKTIVAALRAAGAFVIPTHQMGGGFPDLVVVRKGTISFLEVKDGAKPPSERKLTADEIRFIADCSMQSVQVHVVKSEEEALAAVGVGVAV
jgi:hypothetical protein